MDDFKKLMAEAVEAATQGDVQALLMAQMLLTHLKTQLAQGSCTA
jgi:hypothetical protein